MTQDQNGQDFDIVIVQCCQNCQTHQYLSRHSEWKYFEQFNELKRKIQRFVNNTIVIKNPVPDELTKPPQLKGQKNSYINKETNEKVIFPRIGAFQIYIYNILISSKLISNGWPNHYKVIQTLNKIIEEKKKGNPIDHFSVYQSPEQIQQKKKNKQTVNVSAKKKKSYYRVYKSKDKSNVQKSVEKTVNNIAAIDAKLGKLDPLHNKEPKKKIGQFSSEIPSRYLQSKNDKRVKLPSLRNTISYEKQKQTKKINDPNKQRKNSESMKKIFNSIQELQHQQISLIEKKQTQQNQKFESLDFQGDSIDFKAQVSQEKQLNDEDMRFIQNKSVQYSIREAIKDYMNASIQYQEEQGIRCDFGLQIDDQSIPKQTINQFIQTFLTGDDCFKGKEKQRPYTLDQQVTVNIPVVKDEKTIDVQTIPTPIQHTQTNTQIKNFVTRSAQFPQQQSQHKQGGLHPIDNTFAHMYEKRRNIIDNDYYSVDKFEERATKYKWTGKANLNEPIQKLKQRMFLQSLVFSVYKFFGIKTPLKKLSFQHCGNIVNDKVKQACYHIMTLDNPELHYFFQFQQFDFQKKKFPLSEVLTFKNSKQNVKFANYGGFLAIAYFLNDTQLFHENHVNIGLTITNQEVKEIHKLSAQNFDLHPAKPNQPYEIGCMDQGKYKIKFERLSQEIQFQFITMVSRITSENALLQLSRFVREIFLHNSPTHKDFKDTLVSLNLQAMNEQLVEDFIKVLEFRVNRLREQFNGQIYCYNTYRSLNPQISFNMKSEISIQRKMKYDGKIVSYSDVFKHIRSKDNIVVIIGQSGLGKTFIMQGLVNKLKQNQQVNVLQIDDLGNEYSKYHTQMQDKVKNIIFLDNSDKYIAYISPFIRSNLNKSEISYCLMSTTQKIADRLQAQLKEMKVIRIVLERMGKQDIQTFLMKSISSQSFTAKKQIIEKCVSKAQFRKLLGNPFYAREYARYLSTIDIQKYQPSNADINKYSILKHSFHHVIETHKKQCKALSLKYRQALPLLRKIALEYFHNDGKIDDNVRTLVLQYQTDQLIKNQLCYYPIYSDNLQVRKALFMHQEYFNYVLVEAYSYYIEKGYRDMKMEKLYQNNDLMQLIKQKYKNQRGYGRLLEVVYNTRKFKNTYEQASNAMSLLCRMNYLFSNINFDEVQIPEADLSDAVFYHCSFRGANLSKALLYRTNMITCQVDNAQMSSLDLLNKKFDLQFIALTTSLSPDGKNLALGCGNYLIVLNTDSGKEVKRIQAHLDVIRTVKYSKDGSSLISIADDKTLRIWDVQSYRSVVFKLPQKGSINFSNETETIASISKNSLKVWNLKSMAGESYCQGHSDIITSVHFSRDGNWILTGSRDCTLRLWDLDGQQKYLYKGHNSEIIVGRIAPTNKLIFSSSKDKDLIVWNLFSRSEVKKRQFDDEVTQICPDLKENFVVITFYAKPSIMVLDYHTLQPFYSIKAHNSRILSLGFDAYFKKIISLGKDKTVRIWEFAKMMKIQLGTKQYNIDDGPILALKYSKFDNIYATAHQNGQINIWYSDNHALGVQLKSHNGAVNCLEFDKTGKLYSAGSDGAIRIWNIYEKKQIKCLKIHSQEVISLKLSHKNKLVVSTSKANELVVQDQTGVNVIMSTRQQGRVHAVEFSKDDSIMAIGGVQRYAVIYQINENENSLVRLQQFGQHADTVQSLCFHSDSILLVGLKNGNVVIWNHHKGSLIKKIQNPSAIRSILSFQKKFIVISTEDGKIRVIDMDKGKQMKIFRYSDPALAIDINKNQNLLYTGTQQGNILVWNLDSVHPYPAKVNFDRIAVDSECSQIITIEGPNLLMKKDLFNHSQQQIQVKLQSQIQGVTFIDQRIVVMLKSGQYWQLGKGQFTFQSNISYEGDLFYMRDKKYLNLYKTPVKKIKNLKLPVQLVLQEEQS